MLNLLSLNDDVLLLILSHLNSGSALSLSLASKRAYDLAEFRIASDVRCHSSDELPRLHKYMLEPWNGGLSRAHYLEKFVIGPNVFYTRELGQMGSPLGYNFDQVHLLGDILLEAIHVRELSFAMAHTCIMKDDRIVTALCAMSRLATCHLSTVADDTLTALQSMRTPSLTQLALDYCPSDYLLLWTFPPLWSTLSNFRSLRSVKLSSFTPSIRLAEVGLPLPPYPQLPSIRQLEFHKFCSSYALEMVAFCPNLTVLVLSWISGKDFEVTPATLSRNHGPLSLRRLSLRIAEDSDLIPVEIRSVDRLEITQRFNGYEGPDRAWGQLRPTETLALITRTSPIALCFSIIIEPEAPGSQEIWTSLSQKATRLRSLEIEIAGVRNVRSYTDNYAWIVSAFTHLFHQMFPSHESKHRTHFHMRSPH